jgi:hypothetical protein
MFDWKILGLALDRYRHRRSMLDQVNLQLPGLTPDFVLQASLRVSLSTGTTTVRF